MKKILIAASLICTGCSTPSQAPSSQTPATQSSPVSPLASSTPVADLSQLKAHFQGGKFDYKALQDPKNGPGFLALVGEDGPMATSALEGLSMTYTHYEPDTKKNHPGADYQKVILKELQGQGERLYFAIKAAEALMGAEPDPEVLAALVKMVESHKEVGARYQAMETLFLAKDFLSRPEVASAFLGCLQGAPALQSNALFRFRSNAYSLPNKDRVFQACLKLTSSADPGVRGRTWQVLSELAQGDQKTEVAKLLLPALKDSHPFVRSAAAEALGRLQRDKAVTPLMALLDDRQSNTYDLKFKNLRGRDETVHHDGSPWSRVDDATLFALESATAMLEGKLKFDYASIDYKQVDKGIAAEVTRCKSWYAANKGSF